jgi:hypothetical protein
VQGAYDAAAELLVKAEDKTTGKFEHVIDTKK